MSLTLRDTRYNDVRIIFDEGPHKYTDTLGNEYLSTTTLLHKYLPSFDKKYWLRKKSQELHISEKRLEEQWNTITKEACERGTKTHNGLEDGINVASKFKQAVKYMVDSNDGSMITVADLPNINKNVKELDVKEFIDATENKYPDIYKIFQFYTERDYKIYAEIGMFLIDVLVSGCIDVLCIRDDKFIIGDWKTNRGGLKFEAGYYKKDKTTKPAQMTNEWVKKTDFLLPPVNNLENCNGMIYNLQLSTYAFSVETILGIPCAGLWLCHIDSDFVLNQYGMPKRFPDGLYHVKRNPKEKTTLHKMNYLKKEVMLILNDRLQNVRASQVSVQPSLFD